MVAALIWMQPETSSSKSKHRGFLLNSNKRISWGWRPTNMIWATITGFFNYDYHGKPKNLTCALRLLKRIPQIAQPPWRFRETLGTAERTKVRQQAIVLRMPTQGSHLQGVHGGITQGLAILMLKKHVWYEGNHVFFCECKLSAPEFSSISTLMVSNEIKNAQQVRD